MIRHTMINNLSSIIEQTRMKPILYNSIVSAAQFIALHRLKPFTDQRVPVSKKKIIIHSVHGTYLSAIYKEGALALALRIQGYDAQMLFCNQRITSCCALFTIDHPASKRDCKNCIHFSEQFCQRLNIPRLTYQQFSFAYDNFEQLLRIGMISNGIGEDTIYKNVHIGQHAKTGTDRYFKGEQTDPETYHKHFVSKLIDASIVVDIAEQLHHEEQPDIIITSHSCYSEYGPFSEYFKKQGTPVFTWFTGYEPDTLVFDLPEVGKNYTEWSKRWSTFFTEYTAKPEVTSFIERREQGMGESKLYGIQTTNEDFGFTDKYSLIYGLFPNAPWDADPSCQTLFFPTIIDWVYETIEFFLRNPYHFLIIKTHPSEKLYRSRKTVYDAIKEKYPELPPNIILLPPDTTISVYDLFPHLTVGIVSNSTTGLEMMLNHVPVITVGEAHYRGKGFTYDPKTKKEYIDLIKKGCYQQKNKDQLWLYAYYYFIKSFLPYKVFYKKNFLDIGFTFKELDELKNNKDVMHITECITNGKMFQDWGAI